MKIYDLKETKFKDIPVGCFFLSFAELYLKIRDNQAIEIKSKRFIITSDNKWIGADD